MDVLEMLKQKFAHGKSLRGSGGGPRTSNVWGTLSFGPNNVRFGGAFVIAQQHFISKLLQPAFIRSRDNKDQNSVKFNASVTCLNWDIDNEAPTSDELWCCPLCDLRNAARILEKQAKSAGEADLQKTLENTSGEARPGLRYLWPAIMRDSPYVTVSDAAGNEQEQLGWKVLGLSPEANKFVEMLYTQYPQFLDDDQGCDICITKTKTNRVSYTAAFIMNGPSIAITPLTDEERAMEKLDLKRFIANHVSPRQLYVALLEPYQEMITQVLGKSAEDYPEEPPIKRASAPVKKDDEASTTDISGDFKQPAKTAAPKAPTKAPAKTPTAAPKAPAAAPKQAAPAPKAAPAKPTPPKPAAPPPKPAPAAAPKPAAPKPVAPKPAPAPEPVAEAEPAAEEPAATPPWEENAAELPACFGTADRNDPQCQECQKIDECEQKRDEQA